MLRVVLNVLSWLPRCSPALPTQHMQLTFPRSVPLSNPQPMYASGGSRAPLNSCLTGSTDEQSIGQTRGNTGMIWKLLRVLTECSGALLATGHNVSEFDADIWTRRFGARALLSRLPPEPTSDPECESTPLSSSSLTPKSSISHTPLSLLGTFEFPTPVLTLLESPRSLGICPHHSHHV